MDVEQFLPYHLIQSSEGYHYQGLCCQFCILDQFCIFCQFCIFDLLCIHQLNKCTVSMKVVNSLVAYKIFILHFFFNSPQISPSRGSTSSLSYVTAIHFGRLTSPGVLVMSSAVNSILNLWTSCGIVQSEPQDRDACLAHRWFSFTFTLTGYAWGQMWPMWSHLRS